MGIPDAKTPTILAMPATRSSKRLADARARAAFQTRSAQLVTLQRFTPISDPLSSPCSPSPTTVSSSASTYQYSASGDASYSGSPPATPTPTIPAGSDGTPMSTSSTVRSGDTEPNTPTTPTPPHRGARCSHRPTLQRTYSTILSPADQAAPAANPITLFPTGLDSDEGSGVDLNAPQEETGAPGLFFQYITYGFCFQGASSLLDDFIKIPGEVEPGYGKMRKMRAFRLTGELQFD